MGISAASGVLKSALSEVAVVFQPNRYHAAEAAHLLLGQFVMLVGGQAGVKHFVDGRMLLKPFGQLQSVFAMLAHTQCQRFNAAQH